MLEHIAQATLPCAPDPRAHVVAQTVPDRTLLPPISVGVHVAGISAIAYLNPREARALGVALIAHADAVDRVQNEHGEPVECDGSRACAAGEHIEGCFAGPARAAA